MLNDSIVVEQGALGSQRSRSLLDSTGDPGLPWAKVYHTCFHHVHWTNTSHKFNPLPEEHSGL